MLKQAKDMQDKIVLYGNRINGTKNKKKSNADLKKETQDVIWERLQTLVKFRN